MFRSGDPRQLFLVSKPGKGAKAQAISDASENLHDPTFAPKGDALAAIKQNNAQGGDGDLCFMRVSGSSKVQPGCIPDPQWNLGNRIAWAPDGKSILVYGNQKPATNALLLYESSQAFSTNPSDWGAGKPVTDITKTGEGAFSAAFAPDGKRVAIVATQGSSFQVRDHQGRRLAARPGQAAAGQRLRRRVAPGRRRAPGRELPPRLQLAVRLPDRAGGSQEPQPGDDPRPAGQRSRVGVAEPEDRPAEPRPGAFPVGSGRAVPELPPTGRPRRGVVRGLRRAPSTAEPASS